MSEQVQVVEEVKKGGNFSVVDGKVSIEYGIEFDKDQDGRASAGISAKAFVDLPEVLDESLKDNATAQILAKWIDANKSLLPEVKKDI